VAGSAAAAQPPASPSAPADTLGRETPRDTLFGFIDAAQKNNFDLAALYLNTPLRDKAAAELAQQLFVILDARLPARLQDVSDKPEGSLANPLKPDQDVIGTIATDGGPLDILVERTTRGPAGRVWLFARRTLDQVPTVYDEVHVVSVDRFLPNWLTRPRVAGIRLFDWLGFFIVLPLLYRGLGLLRPFPAVPGAIRLLLLSFVIRIVVRSLDLPLIERQFWTVTTAMLFVTALVWLALLLGRLTEQYLFRHADASLGDTRSLLRLGRRTADIIIVATGLLVVLHYFGVDATAALAGLGIGGIAVALAAQKTLENVIGGVSIIFDRAVKVGDFVKIGTMSGSVESVGLRSTRIRTMDRTMLTVPNGQIATLNIETMSERDKFWFHHVIGVTYGTTAAQLSAIGDDIRGRLRKHPRADDSSIRVRVIRLGASSIDIDVSVYLLARDWDDFAEMQEALLFDVMAIVEGRGSSLAFPTQTLHIGSVRDVTARDGSYLVSLQNAEIHGAEVVTLNAQKRLK
jgi:MscS family membrane protein